MIPLVVYVVVVVVWGVSHWNLIRQLSVKERQVRDCLRVIDTQDRALVEQREAILKQQEAIRVLSRHSIEHDMISTKEAVQ